MRIVRAAAYRSDLEQSLFYIALERPSVALDLWDEIEHQVERLGDCPMSGRTGRVD